MSEAAIVSVIMPCYNQGQYLDEAVDSVLAQTYQNFEIIVINDGSTDAETIGILHHYTKPSVKILHTENCGPSAARNTGIEQSSGRYILPLDADDRIGPTYLEKAVNILEADPDVGIVYAEAEFFGEKTGKWELPDYHFPEILLGNVIFNSSFYRKADWQTIGGYNQNMVYNWEDYDLWLSIIELERKVIRIPEALYFYRQLPNSRDAKTTRDQRVACFTQIFRNHSHLYSENINVLFAHILEQTEGLDYLKAHTRYQEAAWSQSQAKAHEFETELIRTRDFLHDTLAELSRTQTSVQHLETELVKTQDFLKEVQTELNLTQIELEAMKSSKFWKIRSAWFRLKQRVGLPIEDM